MAIHEINGDGTARTTHTIRRLASTASRSEKSSALGTNRTAAFIHILSSLSAFQTS